MAKTISIPVNTRAPGHWKERSLGLRGIFHPNRGRPTLASEGSPLLTPNRHWRSTEDVWSARIFVGFSVGETPTYEMADLIGLVKQVRQDQTGKADSTFLHQRGIYTHADGSGEVTEDGAQVILLNLEDKYEPEEFIQHMIELGEVIREEMQQELVIIEIQRSGIVQENRGVFSDE